MASRLLRRDPFTRARRVLQALCLILVSGCALAGCTATFGPTPADVPTSTRSTVAVTPAFTPTLPTLSAEPGWHSVLRIGYASSGVVTIGGTFEATTSFQVVVVCEGAGQLTVTYATRLATDSETFQCVPAIQQHGVIDMHPPTGQLSVSVSAGNGVMWQDLIEVQD